MRAFLTLHTPALAKAYYADGRWTDDTFYSLLAEQAAARPDALALRDGRASLTWSEVLTRVDALAAEFRARGLTAGDRVSLWMSNRAETVLAFLACSREGLACNPSLHKTYTCGEIVELMTRLQTRILITEDGWGADRATNDFYSMLDELPFLKKSYTPDALPTQPSAPLEAPSNDPDSVAYLAFTSGTTGAPKCVMHSSNTLLSNAREFVESWGFDHSTVLLSLSPLSHHIAWVAVGKWLVSGCVFVTDDRPKGVQPIDWILETGATYVMGVPTHAMDILQAQKSRGLDRIGALREFYMAGAPIPAVVAEAFVEQGIKPLNVYGMTENSSHQFTHPGDSPQTWTTTCGRGGRGYEVRIFSAEDEDIEAAPGETGQIAGRGSDLMLGYFGGQGPTEKSFNSSGWFLSGDLGSMDEHGNLRIEGRLKDLIIRGGHNIHPSHIEALALRHDAIDQAAAFPIPDERLGEKVCLAVKGRADADETLHHLWSQGLSKFDMPEWFVRVEEFPLTPSGKIMKRELIALREKGEIEPAPVRFKAPSEDSA